MSDSIELDKPIIEIMKSLPDSGTLHPAAFEEELKLRKHHADLWLDKVPWFNQYMQWRNLGMECVSKNLPMIVDRQASAEDVELLKKFKPYEPDFEDTLI